MGKRGSSSSLRGGNAIKKRKSNTRTSANCIEKLYTLSDEILVLGDGDFTFSRGLVTHRGGGRKLLATSYDSEAKVKAKYSNAAECIKEVQAAGAQVLHEIDATKLHLLPRRLNATGASVRSFFKYIIFNFPHTGQQRVHINRALLLEFFESARNKLIKAGEVHITLKNRPPYSNWLVEDQAKTAGFVLKERRQFNLRNFPGYHHRTTDPHAKVFEAELCITYVFVVNRSKYPFQAIVEIEREQLTEESVAPSSEDPEPYGSGDDATVQQVETSTRTTKRKRTKRKGTNHAAPTVTIVQPLDRKRSASFVLWRPLHRR